MAAIKRHMLSIEDRIIELAGMSANGYNGRREAAGVATTIDPETSIMPAE
ncbi:MAG: hypothetical protein ABJI96_18275 [Paracoccaceae bacterium]